MKDLKTGKVKSLVILMPHRQKACLIIILAYFSIYTHTFDDVYLEVQEVQVGRQAKILWQTTNIQKCKGIHGWSGM